MNFIRTLVICEKPSAAFRVAVALDEDASPRKKYVRGVPYFESVMEDGIAIVCSAIGHLYSVDSKGQSSRRFYPVWDCAWKPKHEIDRRSARLSRWIEVINRLANGVDRFVNACDHDIEGSLIGHSVLQYACEGAHLVAHRMKFSTMTEKELKAAFQKLDPHLDFSTVEAGRSRHVVDWIYGVNLSRILTEATFKQGRGYTTLSTGRVQGPTLNFVVSREEEIESFVPTPYWVIDAFVSREDSEFRLKYYVDRIATLRAADAIVNECQGRSLKLADIESNEIRETPPYPFDLAALQSEAFRHFGFYPAKTLAIAERLYLDALVSYPRTSSQKLPPDIGYDEIMRGIAAHPDYAGLVRKLVSGRVNLRPNQGPKDDPAHPSIYPTGDRPKRRLLSHEQRLFDLIVKRFLATFADAYVRLTSKMVFECASHRFFLKGSKHLRLGWIEFYRPYAGEHPIELPELKVGIELPISKIQAEQKFTEPPRRYNPSSLLAKMESEGIGTKATRAEIIETLYQRQYVKGIHMEPTPLAVQLTRLLAKRCPLIINSEFTAKLETLMEKIEQKSPDRRLVIMGAVDNLRPVIVDLSYDEDNVGSQLADVASAQRAAEQSFQHPCPTCGSALSVVRNRKTRKRFVGCTGKWAKKCGFSLPLPPFGALTILRRSCTMCGFQMIRSQTKRGRSLVSCPRCYVEKHRTVLAGKTVAPISLSATA